jgi:prepilin-type N-terminal cleavage/methylation domain-containing protein
MSHRPRHSIRGFTLTEMAIVLAVVGVLIAGLWNIISGANQQSRDTSAATQQTQLINAIKEFLQSQPGQQYMTSNLACGATPCAASVFFPLPLPSAANPAGSAGCVGDGALLADMPAGGVGTTGYSERSTWCGFLPPGFSGGVGGTVNSYGQTYLIQVLRDTTPAGSPPSSYSFMIMTKLGSKITDTSGARISALIGGDGGFIYTNAVCTTPPTTANTLACGSYGSWTANPVTNYGFGASVSGTVASRTYMSSQLNSLTDWLARIPMPGDTTMYTLNTMTTPEYLGDNALVMGKFTLGATPDTTSQSIYMGDYNTAPPSTGGGAINMQGGNFNFVLPPPPPPAVDYTTGGTMDMQGGTLNFSNGIIEGDATMGADRMTITDPVSAANPTAGLYLVGTMQYAGGVSPSPILSVVGGCTSVTSGPGTTNPNSQPPGVVSPNACQTALQVTGDANVFGLLQAYNLYAGTFIYQSSDMRLKSDIHPLKGALEDIMKLKPVSFVLDTDGQPSMGVIAQDLEKIYPDLVVTHKDLKYVNYDGLIAPLIEAVQELKQDNDELREELHKQALKQDELTKALAAQKAAVH